MRGVIIGVDIYGHLVDRTQLHFIVVRMMYQRKQQIIPMLIAWLCKHSMMTVSDKIWVYQGYYKDHNMVARERNVRADSYVGQRILHSFACMQTLCDSEK